MRDSPTRRSPPELPTSVPRQMTIPVICLPLPNRLTAAGPHSLPRLFLEGLGPCRGHVRHVARLPDDQAP